MLKKKTILIIDDEVNFCRLLKMNIQKNTKYEGIWATSGEEGLEMIKRQRPDLVLLDIMMPGMDGLETLKRIKAFDPELPVVMVTAVWDKDQGQKCFDAGACEYITKPVDFNYLITTMLIKLL